MAPKWFPKVNASLPSMEGKTVVITGTTSGTGLVALETLLLHGGSVLALNRNTEKAIKSVNGLAELTEELKAKVVHIECDLQSFESVKKASERVYEECSQHGIYCLANNAGVMMLPDKATEDGYDVQAQTNLLSHYLLVQLLLPLLEKYSEKFGEARIVNHSSIVRNYFNGHVNEKYFQKNGGKLGGNGTYARMYRYSQSKLGNSVFSYALIDKLDEKYGGRDKYKIKVVTCHPGIAKTELFSDVGTKDGNLGSMLIQKFSNHMSQHMKDGALGLIKSICLTDVQTGDFFGPGKGGSKGDAYKFKVEARSTNPKNKQLIIALSEKAVSGYLV